MFIIYEATVVLIGNDITGITDLDQEAQKEDDAGGFFIQPHTLYTYRLTIILQYVFCKLAVVYHMVNNWW